MVGSQPLSDLRISRSDALALVRIFMLSAGTPSFSREKSAKVSASFEANFAGGEAS